MRKRYFTFFVLFAFLLSGGGASVSKADSVAVEPYISFGEDLTDSEKDTVMELLEISEEELEDYEVVEVSNEEEHEFLDEYMEASVIGTRALSSVKIEEADAGSGISVETHNISYCTEEMYTNALVTAGISDADVTVAGPFQLSGTAALIGAMKAYEVMTGEEIDAEQADTAMNELVFTGEMGNEIGMEEAAELVALVKHKVVEEGLESEDEIVDAIDESCKELGVDLSEERKEELLALMNKIGGLDLDMSVIKEQAKGIYDKFKEMDIDIDTAGFWEAICDFFAQLWEMIVDFFKNL